MLSKIIKTIFPCFFFHIIVFETLWVIFYFIQKKKKVNAFGKRSARAEPNDKLSCFIAGQV